MTAPVRRVQYGRYTDPYSYRKVYHVQKPPFNLRLPCSLTYYRAYNRYGSSQSWNVVPQSSPLWDKLSNQARERFRAKIGDTASLGAALTAERREASEMMRTRVLQLLRFTKAIRKGKLRQAAVILGIKTPKGALRKLRAKDLGSLWLEYSYGWAPLVSDIYGALRIIDAPPPAQLIRGRAQDSTESFQIDPVSPAMRSFTKWEHRCQVLATVTVADNDAYLANQLGLTNPVTWVLEAIPFSFVVDWFSNLSQWVSQKTDFLGCTIDQPVTTHVVTYRRHDWQDWSGALYEGPDKGFTSMIRESGIPDVVLNFGYEIPSWKRGLNAISLLTQALRSL